MALRLTARLASCEVDPVDLRQPLAGRRFDILAAPAAGPGDAKRLLGGFFRGAHGPRVRHDRLRFCLRGVLVV